MSVTHEIDDYVPKIMDFDDESYGYGDYIEFSVNEDGYIENWPNNERIKFFIDDFLDEEKDDY